MIDYCHQSRNGSKLALTSCTVEPDYGYSSKFEMSPSPFTVGKYGGFIFFFESSSQ